MDCIGSLHSWSVQRSHHYHPLEVLLGRALRFEALDSTSFLWVKDGFLLLGLLPLILFLTPGDCKNFITTEPRELSGIILFSPA